MSHREDTPSEPAPSRASAGRRRGLAASLAPADALGRTAAKLRGLLGASRERHREDALGLAEYKLVSALGEAGCPICATSRDNDRRYFSWLLIEGYSDPGVLDEFARALGFCAGHARYAITECSAHGQLGTLHAAAVGQLRRRFADDRRRRAWEGEVDAAGGRPQPCPACRADAETVRRTAFFLANLIERGRDRGRYGAPGLLCLPHLRLTAPYLTDPTLGRLLARHEAALGEAVAGRRSGARRPHTHDREADAAALRLAVGHPPALEDWPPSCSARAPARHGDAVATLVTDLRGAHCPVCLEVVRAGADWGAWLDEAARKGETVSDLLPGCPRHLWASHQRAGPALAAALVDQALGGAHYAVAFALAKLRERPPAPELRRPVEALGRLLEGRRPLIRLARGALGRPPGCPLCRRLAVARDRTLGLLAALLETPRHRTDYENGHGLCLDHFARLIALDPPPAVRAFLYDAQGAKLAVLGWDLGELSRKSAWQWRPEPRGREQASPRRALARFSGLLDLAAE